MPHLVLEYTDNVVQPVDFHHLFAELHQTLVSTAGVALDACKGRALPLETYHVGAEGAGRAFVHLEIGLLAGRPPEKKIEITTACARVLAAYYEPALRSLDLQISVELRDIDRDSYRKIVPG